MLFSVSLIPTAVIISAVMISGNVLPVTVDVDRWIPSNEHNARQVATQQQRRPTAQSYSPYYQYSIQHPMNPDSTSTQEDNSDPHTLLLVKQRQQPLDPIFSKESQPGPSNSLEIERQSEGHKDIVFQEKLGLSSILSSLLPTSILSMPHDESTSPLESMNAENNIIETDSKPYQDSKQSVVGFPQFGFPSRPNDNEVGGNYDSGMQQLADDSEDSQQQEGLFSRIRNVLPFGKGFLSGFLNRENVDTTQDDSSGGTSSLFSFLDNSNNNNYGGYEKSNATSLFSIDPSQISLSANDDESSTSDDNESAPADTGSSSTGFLSSLPNPISGLRNLLNSISTSGDDDTAQAVPEEGGYINESSNPGDPGDSSITALQSIADGGLGGTLGLFIPYLSHLATTFGIAKAKLPVLKLLGAVLGPILAAAIAAMVVGIVYLAIYISGEVIQNAGIEGEMYLISIQQLLSLLGIPDPLEELFGIGIFRSLQGRSFQSRRSLQNSLYEESNHSILAVKSPKDMCMERLACHAIGKKLMRKPSWKGGRIESGIKWITGNLTRETHSSSLNSLLGNSTFSRVLRKGKLFIDAIAVGMESAPIVHGNSNGTNMESACARFSCDPIMLLQSIFKPTEETQKRSLPNVENKILQTAALYSLSV